MASSLLLRRLSQAVVSGFLALAALAAQAASKPAAARDDFMPFVQLAPFMVNGQRLAISIHARTAKDRRYAEAFAEEVVKVVNEAVTPETGKGLVIIGRKGEPHPVFVLRQFLALAEAGKLDPEVAARAPELSGMLGQWQEGFGNGSIHVEANGHGDDLEFEKIVAALPLPLEGLGAKLYQLAWTEGFDSARVEARWRTLRVGDLDGNLFARFDWVFYLPPRGALEDAIDELIADALKQEKLGFFERTAAKGVMLFLKPMIRKVIEGLRQGMFFQTVVQARAGYGREDVSSLTSAYVNVLMPGQKEKGSGREHDRAVQAVREQVRRLAQSGEKPRA